MATSIEKVIGSSRETSIINIFQATGKEENTDGFGWVDTGTNAVQKNQSFPIQLSLL